MAEKAVANASFWDFKGSDDDVDKWPLMGSPWAVLFMLTSYLFFVLYCGPQFMKNRPRYKPRRVLMVYNAFQVLYSCYIFQIGISAILEVGLVEDGCIKDHPALKRRITEGHYLYFLAKLSEFLDTIFFVLRKKWDQISFLHVYHHFIMFVSAWMTLKYEPTYSLVFLGTINSFVHIIMYAYYGLSAFPRLQKYLWWKKHITKMQLVQFLLVMIQILWNSNVTKCPPSYILLTLTYSHGFLFIYLFADFYVKSYMQKRKESQERERLNSENHENKNKNKYLNNSSEHVKRKVINRSR